MIKNKSWNQKATRQKSRPKHAHPAPSVSPIRSGKPLKKKPRCGEWLRRNSRATPPSRSPPASLLQIPPQSRQRSTPISSASSGVFICSQRSSGTKYPTKADPANSRKFARRRKRCRKPSGEITPFESVRLVSPPLGAMHFGSGYPILFDGWHRPWTLPAMRLRPD